MEKRKLPKPTLVLIGLLVFIVLIGCAGGAYYKIRKKIDEKNAAYNELQTEKQKIEKECSATEATKKELETKVAEQETALAEKDKAIADRDAQIKKLNQEIINLKK